MVADPCQALGLVVRMICYSLHRASPGHARALGGGVGRVPWAQRLREQLGRVGLGFQPEPSRRQIPKTQAPLRVWVVAGGHAAPWLKPPEAPFPRHPARPPVILPASLTLGAFSQGRPPMTYPDDRYPMAPHPFFSGYLFRHTRRQGYALPSLRGSVALDGTDGRRALPPEYGKWNSVYGRYAA